MTLTVAVQMDHIQRIRIAGDSTFALLLEAQARGHKLLHYTPERLSMRDGRIVTMAEPIEVRDVEGDHVTMGAAERVDLATVDVVLLRQDPPFDLAYITTTHLLERIHPRGSRLLGEADHDPVRLPRLPSHHRPRHGPAR